MLDRHEPKLNFSGSFWGGTLPTNKPNYSKANACQLIGHNRFFPDDPTRQQ
jgi:hypothetical protein